jgi:hypothetical protein
VRFEVPTAVSIEVIWFSRMRLCIVLGKCTASTFNVDDFSAFKMEAADSFEMLITSNQNTQHHILED